MDETLKWVPLIGLCITSASLIFTTAVLYPWHARLSDQFEELKKTCSVHNQDLLSGL